MGAEVGADVLQYFNDMILDGAAGDVQLLRYFIDAISLHPAQLENELLLI
jgi:hypothetical protein